MSFGRSLQIHLEVEKELKGGKVNYYLVHVKHPQRKEQQPYQAECEDITEALGLTPDEFCIFKAIWRSANARQGNGKPDHKALYDAQKIVHYAERNLRRLMNKAKDESNQSQGNVSTDGGMGST